MWLKLLHTLGLTNLTAEQVAAYSAGETMLGDAAQVEGVSFARLVQQHRPTQAQLRDIEMFLRDGRNIMDAAQLAQEQVSQNPMQIHVVAPVPLEKDNDQVRASTIAWLRTNIGRPEARIIFWTKASDGDNPPLVLIVQMLLADMDGDTRILPHIECVQAPDELYFTDFTLWRMPHGKVRAFVNERMRETTSRLFELRREAAHDFDDKLSHLLERCEEDTLEIHDPGRRYSRDAQRGDPNVYTPHSITRWRMLGLGAVPTEQPRPEALARTSRTKERAPTDE